ncbi:MAG: virulence RhuM family protein, partial [Candidatus Fibromonas sp.]|nr:virulence RhuM family protein [Candidatus Fibromonas sp.]
MSKKLTIGKSQFLIYQNENGITKLEVRFDNSDVWLTQEQLASLFEIERPGVTQHIKNIFVEGELEENSVSKKFLRTASDGKNYEVKHYSLDMIISLGYRVNSGQTAAEIIYSRADSEKKNMGLTSWRGSRIRKTDVSIAKNYLSKGEIQGLNDLVEQYLIFAQTQARARKPMTMQGWV